MLKGDATCLDDGRCQLTSNDMTIEMCKEYCIQNGWAIAGVEYSKQCFCGNEIPTKMISQSKCKHRCRGNSDQMCGGSWAMNIHHLPGIAVIHNDLQISKI